MKKKKSVVNVAENNVTIENSVVVRRVQVVHDLDHDHVVVSVAVAVVVAVVTVDDEVATAEVEVWAADERERKEEEEVAVADHLEVDQPAAVEVYHDDAVHVVDV